MGVRLQLLLTIGCVAGLTGLAFGQSHCKTTSWGDTSGIPHAYTPIPLQPAVRDWQLTISHPSECPYGGVVGVTVTGCDYDKAPQLKFMDKLFVFVHRIGRIEYPASATASVYCGNIFGGAKNSPRVEAIAWDGNNWHKDSGLVAIPN